jgi:hypothetical protein
MSDTTIYGEMAAGISEVARAIVAYQNNMKPREKTEEELKIEEIRIKALLPAHCGNNVDIFV